MNKVSVEISAQTQAYVQGINKATESAEKYETETRKVSDAQVNLMKELRAAKKDVQNLAAGYAKLDSEAKNSAFGQEMARQLQIAKQKAAEYVDLQGDLQQELRNMASDTRALDTLAEGMGIVGDAAAAVTGVIAHFTGNEEDARKAVIAFTTAQSALGTVTKLQNALQKQSNIMMAVAKVQTAAAAAATNAQAAATGKATIAQKAFNAVAKANPYVLLASAIAIVTAAVYAYIVATRKAETATENIDKKLHDTSIQAQKDAQADVTKLKLLYDATQDQTKSVEERTAAAKKMQQLYPGYLGNLTTEKILAGEAADAYKTLTEDIIAAANARALENRIAKLGEELIDMKDALDESDKALKQYEKAADSAKNSINGLSNVSTQYGASFNYTIDNANKATQKLNEQKKANQELRQSIIDKEKEQQKYADEALKLIPQTTRLEEGTKNVTEKTGKAISSNKDNTKELVKQLTLSENTIEKLEQKISALQTLAKRGMLPDDLKDPKVFNKTLGALEDHLIKLKVEWGFAKAKPKLQELKEDVESAREAYIMAVETDNEQAKKEAYEAFNAAQKRLDEHQLKIKINPVMSEAELKKQLTSINEIFEAAIDVRKELSDTYDFSALPESYKDAASETIDAMKRVEAAKKQLEDKRNKLLEENPVGNQEAIKAIDATIEKLDMQNDALEVQANLYQKITNEAKKSADEIENISSTVSQVGNAVAAAGQLFSALGDVADDTSLRAAGIVAQAVATVALSYAQALKSCKTWVDWLAFGMTGLATMINMINQIKSATAGSFAEGGIVGGSSYHGDRLTARVNSGEMILNDKQQKKLFDLLDSDAMPQKGGTNVTVTGVIRGTDLMLVQRNTAKVMKKAGNSINF